MNPALLSREKGCPAVPCLALSKLKVFQGIECIHAGVPPPKQAHSPEGPLQTNTISKPHAPWS